MAPALKGSAAAAVTSANNVATPTTLNPTLPAHAIGDLLLCYTACRSGTPTVATPAGWTSLANIVGTNGRLVLFGKVAASASEATPAVTWSGLTTGTSGTPVQAQCAVFTGMQNVITGIADVVGAVENGAASTTVSASGAAITTLTADDLVLALTTRLDDAGTFTAPSGFTEVGEAGSTSGIDMAFSWAYQVKTTPGSVAPADFGLASAVSFASSGVLVALKPVPAPKTTGVAQISLAAAATPAAQTTHSIKVRARVTAGPGTSTIRAALYEGATNRSGDLESSGLTTSLADYTLAIPDASAATITDYSNLEIRVWGYNADGTARTFEVDQVWLELPAPAGAARTQTVSDGFGLTDATARARGFGRARADTFGLTDRTVVGYPAVVMADGPNIYWRLGEASGNAIDFMGHLNAAASGPPTYGLPGVSGDADKAMGFYNGPLLSADRFSAYGTLGQVYTIEAWIKLAATGQQHTIVSHGYDTFELGIDSTGHLYLLAPAYLMLGTSTATITDTTTWHHVVATKNGTTVKLYIDGVDVTGGTGARITGGGAYDFLVGRASPNYDSPANAALDEIALYTTVLSPTRVAAHYAAAKPPTPPILRTVSDGFALTDATARVRGRGVTVADGFGLTDAEREARGKRISDGFGLTDARAFFRKKRPQDTFGLTDARTFVKGKSRAIADTFGLTDARRKAVGKTRTDTFGLTDARTRVATVKRTLGDALGLTDTRRATHVVVKPDTFGLTDARTRTAAFKRTRTDTFGLTDAERETRGKKIADTFGLTDARARVAAFKRTVAETFGLTDLATPVKTVGGVAKTKSLADTLGLTESGLVTWTANRSTDEQFLLTDAVTPVKTVGSHARTQTVSDGFALTDAERETRGKRLADAFGLTDARRRSFGKKLAEAFGLADAERETRGKRIADALGLTDARARVTQTKRTVSDGFALTDARKATHVVVKPDTFGLTDARARSVGYRRSRADAFGLTDLRSSARAIKRTVADAFGLTDARALSRAIKRTRADIFGLTDAERESRTKALSETFGLTDQQTRRINWKRTRADALGFTDTRTPILTKVGQHTRLVPDLFGLTDARTRRVTWHRAQADAFGFTDARAKSIGKKRADIFGLTDAEWEARGKRITDTFGLTDQRPRTVTYHRTVTDTFGLTDARVLFKGKRVTVTDGFGLTDARVRVVTWKRTRADTFGLTDARPRVVTFHRTVADGLAFTDQAARARVIRRTRADGFGLTDQIRTGFAPTDIAGLGAWYDASQLGLADGAALTSWPDLSGGNHSLVPLGSAANAPVYKTGILKGLPVVRFDGTDDVMRVTNAVAFSYQHFFVVARYTLATFNDYDGLLSGASTHILIGTQGTNAFYAPFAQAAEYRRGGVVDPTRQGPMTRWEHMGIAFDAPLPADYFQIGLDRNYPPRYWHGDVAEVIAYDRKLSDTERQQVEAYLYAKWIPSQAHTRSVSDGFGLTDGKRATRSKQVADSITFTDARTRRVTWKRTRADSIAFTDSRTKAATIRRTRADSIAFTDTRTRVVGWHRPQFDTFTLTDGYAEVATSVRTIDDTLVLSDAIQFAGLFLPDLEREIVVVIDYAPTEAVIDAVTATAIDYAPVEAVIDKPGEVEIDEGELVVSRS